jgi:hypothetical protein
MLVAACRLESLWASGDALPSLSVIIPARQHVTNNFSQPLKHKIEHDGAETAPGSSPVRTARTGP